MSEKKEERKKQIQATVGREGVWGQGADMTIKHRRRIVSDRKKKGCPNTTT